MAERVTYSGVVNVVAALSAVVILVITCLSVLYPFNLNGVDTNVVYTIQQILEDNRSLYASPISFPFAITQYSPLMYIIMDGVATACGIEAGHWHALLIACRSVTAIVFLVSLLLIFSTMVKDLGATKSSAMLYSLFFGVCTLPWLSMARPDAYIILTVIITVHFLLDGFKKRNAVWIGFLSVVGIGFKLTFCIYAAAILIGALGARQFKFASVMCATCILTTALFLAAMHALGYDMTFFIDNAVLGVNNGIDFSAATENIYLPGALVFIPIIIFILVFIGNASILQDGRAAKLVKMFLLVFVAALVLALKIGSAINYLFESLLLLILLVARVSQSSANIVRLQPLVMLIAIFSFQVSILKSYAYGPRLIVQNTEYLNGTLPIVNDRDSVLQFLAGNRFDYIYTEDKIIGLNYPNRVLLYHNDIHRLTFSRRVYDYSNFEDLLRSGNIKYLVLDGRKKSLYGIAIEENYKLVKEIGPYLIFQSTLLKEL